MILINLLPHREEKRRRRKQAFFAVLGFSALGGALIVALWYAVLQQMISTQQERNAFLQQEIAKLDEQIKDIANLRAEIEALKARQRAVEDLQTDRNMPVHLLNELVRQTPEGVYLTAIRQDGQAVSINGVAQTNERVSEMLRNTAYNSTWLERPELIEIKAANVRTDGREQRRLFEFSMRVSLKRPQDASAPAAAASAPVGSPS
ncbi:MULTISPECIES: PilN domain-containing protein [Caldimonas]|uniref:PilN domain-containing protein n=1 Tax=Caldimonas TaxID=196013 RepID=UPI00036213DC|nr:MULTISPECIES: PilN domain-containing protein [Caldimonas]GIX23009.1 MAG: fimbrial protein [Caldimonas sp.]